MDMNQLIQRIIKNFEPRISELNGKLELHLDAKKSKIEGDEIHITNILYNLLDNAIKYCDKTPLIIVTTANKHRGLEISVMVKELASNPRK